MDSAVWIPIGVLGAANVIFLVLLVALARELGVILVRLGPSTVRPATDDLPIGHTVAPFDLETLAGERIHVGTTKFQPKVLVFVAPNCDSCKQVVPGLRTLASSYAGEATVVAISSGSRSPDDFALAARLAPEVPYACSAEIAERFKIHLTPYVVLLDAQNVVRAKGIANNLQHLESLFALEVRQLAGKPLPGLAEHTMHGGAGVS